MKKNIIIIASAVACIAGIAGAVGFTQMNKQKTQNTVYENLQYGTHERNVLDLYLPENTKETGLVLFIHGGAWVSGDKSAFSVHAKKACEKLNVAAATINYRYLSPEITMEDILSDIDAAVSKIKVVGKENGINIRKMLLSGHSAGGHLSMLYAYKMAETAEIKPAAVANYSGPTNMADENYFINNDLGNDTVLTLLTYATGKQITAENIWDSLSDIEKISPVYYINESTVPTIINHGTADTVVPYSNAVTLNEKLTEYNVTHILNPYEGSGHGLENNKKNESYADSLARQYINEYVLK